MSLCVVASIGDLAISLLMPHLSINSWVVMGPCILDDTTPLIIYPKDPSMIPYEP